VERFRIGAAPDRWDGLITYASDRGLSEAALLGAGLVKRRESGGVYDALRNRLIFPIADATGRPIAFGGRKILDEDEPKYLNSPETALFHKSRTLYGLDLAGKAIRAEKRAVVVEGYTDVIACHAAGIEHVVGTLGTALTAEHARFLRGRAEEIVLLFDGDEAGQRAADRAFEVLFRAMVDVRVATLAGNELAAKDPDELLASAGGRELFERALDGAEHITDFWARRLRERLAGAGPAAVAAAVKDELARLHDLGLGTVSPVERRLLLERLANSAGVPIEALLGQAPAGRRRGPEVREPESVRIRPKDAPDLWRLVLAGVMARPARSLERGELVLELIARMPEGPLWMTRVRDSIAALLAGGSPPGFAAVMREDGSELTEAAVSALGREHEHEFGDDITTAERMWEDAVERLRLTAPPRTGTAEGDGSSIEQEPGAGGLPASELEARMSRAREIGRRLGTNPTAHPALSRRRPRQ
ncbi:MAG: toprim domain-containing protein, partial [Planctomycetota bacterium]